MGWVDVRDKTTNVWKRIALIAKREERGEGEKVK